MNPPPSSLVVMLNRNVSLTGLRITPMPSMIARPRCPGKSIAGQKAPESRDTVASTAYGAARIARGTISIFYEEAARMPEREPVIDMAAIVESTACSKAVLLNDRICLGAVHEGNGQAPAALVEIAGGTSVMPGVRHMTPCGETPYTVRDISGLFEVFDERLPSVAQARCHSDFMARCRNDRYEASTIHYRAGRTHGMEAVMGVMAMSGVGGWDREE
jgi:hypothetical protein